MEDLQLPQNHMVLAVAFFCFLLSMKNALTFGDMNETNSGE
jgi:hypothetical protein